MAVDRSRVPGLSRLGSQIAVLAALNRWYLNMKPPLRSLVAASLSLALFADLPLPAQSPPSPIDLVVIKGEGAIYRPGQRAEGLIVRVEDAEHRPLAGASVTFALPASGASGGFTNGLQTATIITNNQGLAASPGFRLNQIAGKLQVYVTASYGGLRANELIDQVVQGSSGASAQQMQPRKSGHAWAWLLVGLVAAAGAGGGYYYYNKHGSSPGSSISITAGTPAFGGPH